MKRGLVLFFTIASLIAKSQVGINTNSPDSSSILHIESNTKGVLLPRVAILDVNSKSPVPVSVTPKDGLLVYNTNVSPQTFERLYFWQASKWNKVLNFTETPKVAIIGLTNDTSKLDNLNAGGNERLVTSGVNNYYIINSGYIPSLGFVEDTRPTNTTPASQPRNSWDIVVPAGSYTMEIVCVLNAPAPDSGRGNPIAGSYYNMGYFTDIRAFPYNPATWASSTITVLPARGRLEKSVLTKTNTEHSVSFLHSFDVSEPTAVELSIGRMQGSSHNDLVNLKNSSYIKITKLK